MKYSLDQRLQVIQMYYKNSSSIIQTCRALHDFYDQNNRPSEQTVRRIVQRFETTYSLHDNIMPLRKRQGRSVENIAAVDSSVRKNPTLSISRRSKELGLSYGTTRRILQGDLGLQPSLQEPDSSDKELPQDSDEELPAILQKSTKKIKLKEELVDVDDDEESK